MTDDLVKVTVADGKYTFGQRKDGSCYALRYGDPWREDIFDGLTLAMAHRIEQLVATNEALTEERERLALAICGGEDAPGYANAQTVETLEDVARDWGVGMMEQINRTLALEAKLATCEKYRDAYAECDRIGTQAVRDLEAKLAKVVGLLEAWVELSEHCSIEEGVCCCGDNMENHTNPMDCGHTPLDHGTYIAIQLAEETRAALAEISSEAALNKGESHE